MLRKKLAEKHIGLKEGFEWRGAEITRFESLSDAVFGFAVTLLIVSLEVPKTFGELQQTMHGFFAFAICFVLLMLIWFQQYIFFRRYGLQDTWTILLNATLLFMVLFYIYPLKFLFTLLVNVWMGIPPEVTLANGTVHPVILQEQVPKLMLVYSGGYVALFVIFTLMFLHAYGLRKALGLTRLEIFETRTSIGNCVINVCVGAISFAVALIGGVKYSGLAGLVYPFLLFPASTVFGVVSGRRRRLLTQQLGGEAA
ncbi:MAG: TMEM175 family protein [Candidatus Acidiferrales bacterium]